MTSSFQSAKRKGMRTFITTTAILMLLQMAVAPLSGVPAAASSSTDTKVTTAGSTTIYKTFQSMLYKKNGLPAVDIYLESHINQVTTYHATLMVL